MRSLLGAIIARTLAGALSAILGRPRRAFAHSLDELLQQMYVTPTEAGVCVEVHIAPGELVAAEFAAILDINDDGVISEADLAARLEVVRRAIAVRFDGRSVATRMTGSTPLDGAALRAGYGGLDVAIEAEAPADCAPPWRISVSNTYAPFDGVVQSNVTLSADSGLTVTEMVRTPDGRTIELDVRPA